MDTNSHQIVFSSCFWTPKKVRIPIYIKLLSSHVALQPKRDQRTRRNSISCQATFNRRPFKPKRSSEKKWIFQVVSMHFMCFSSDTRERNTGLPQERWNNRFCLFFHPHKNLSKAEYHPHTSILEDLSHSWGAGVPPWIVFWVLLFNKGFVGSSIMWGTVSSKDAEQYGVLKYMKQLYPKKVEKSSVCFWFQKNQSKVE